MRLCRYCQKPLPEGCSSRRIYCCEKHRRQAQDERRKDERAEAREIKKNEKPMTDPWSRNDLDDWTIEQIYKNALLDPLPDSFTGIKKDSPTPPEQSGVGERVRE